MRELLSFYQVFVRNYSAEVTLKRVEYDLNRIRDMGFDYVYLLPVHPIGEKGRKGTYGSPYAIADYDAVDPDLGTMDDFLDLVHAAHARGLKVMMDIVLHHSAADHPWLKKHPSWYAKENAVADWSDVRDFNFESEELRETLLDSLLHWVEDGVDGFRCDVASLVPLSFWKDLRSRAKMLNPQFVMLAESVESPFVLWMRSKGIDALSDGELAQAFDDLYPYTVREEMEDAMTHSNLVPYEKAVNQLLASLPSSTREIWYLENHDRKRIYSLLNENETKFRNWLAWSFFMPGDAFVYNGQEAYAIHQPSLFEKDPIDWSKRDQKLEETIAAYNRMRRKMMGQIRCGFFMENDALFETALYGETETFAGLYNVRGRGGLLHTHLKNDEYLNVLTGKPVTITDGDVAADALPALLKISPDSWERQ